MTSQRFVLSLLLVPFFFSGLSAQSSMIFSPIDERAGLANGWIRHIVQDDIGFLWLSTADGLQRFDGIEMTTYTQVLGEVNSLSSPSIRKAVIDGDGVLWVLTDQGLNKIDRKKGEVGPLVSGFGEPAPQVPMADGFLDSDGILWIATEGSGVFRYDTELLRGELIEIPDPVVRTIYPMPSRGEFAVGTDSGLYRLNYGGQDIYSLESLGFEGMSIRSFLMDSRGYMWVGTNGQGVFSQGPSGTETNYTVARGDLGSDLIRTIVEDPDGVIWVGTDRGGLHRHDPGQDTFVGYRAGENAPGLQDNVITAHYIDESGIHWVGGFSGGLVYSSPLIAQFQVIKPGGDGDRGSELNLVRSIYSTSRGTWFGTDGGGLSFYDHESESFRQYSVENGDLVDDVILALEPDGQGRIWLGHYRGGLSLFDPQVGTIDHWIRGDDSGFEAQFVRSIVRDGEGGIWVGTIDGGLFELDSKGVVISHPVPSELNTQGGLQLVDVAIGPDGTLWLASYGAGLVSYRPSDGQWVQYISSPRDETTINSNDVWTVVPEFNNRFVWVGTNAGFSRLDRYSGDFARYSVRSLLDRNQASESVLSLAFGNEDELWMGTSRGLVRFDSQTGDAQLFNSSHGLPDDSFALGAMYRSTGGILYFGGNEGVAAFDPMVLQRNEMIPPIALTSLNYGVREKTPVLAPELLNSLELSWTDSLVEFEFKALNFLFSEQNQLQYRMDGLDPQGLWNDSSDGTGRYTNIPGGSYVLQLRGSNNDGVWNEIGVSLPIQVSLALWQMPVFYVILVALLLFVGFWVVTNHTKRLQGSNQKLSASVDERNQQLVMANTRLEEALFELKQTQEQLIQSERLAVSAGLTSGLATELNSPVGISITAASYLERKASSILDRLILGEQLPQGETQSLAEIARDSASSVLRNMQRLTAYIEYIKEIALKPEEYEPGSVQLPQFFEDIVEAIRIEEKRDIHILSEGQTTLFTYPSALSQAMRLTLLGLGQAHGESDQSPRLTLSFHRERNDYYVHILATPSTLTAGQINRMFKPILANFRDWGDRTNVNFYVAHTLVTSVLKGSMFVEPLKENGVEVVFRIQYRVVETRS